MCQGGSCGSQDGWTTPGKQARFYICRLNIPSGALCLFYRTKILTSTATYGLFVNLENGNIKTNLSCNGAVGQHKPYFHTCLTQKN